MSEPSPARQTLAKLALVITSMLFALLIVEVGLRLVKPKPSPGPHTSATLLCGSCSHLFELNPRHPTISPQGLRDREFTPEPPEGTYRVLVLGDSVSYGVRTKAEDAFPKRLERLLGERWGKIEILNAGVPGYSPYNEWQLYLNKLRRFHANLVIVSVCLNDVVDPSLHWLRLISPALAHAVPDEAVPDPARHRASVLPFIDGVLANDASRSRRLLLRSSLYQRVDAYRRATKPMAHVTVNGKRVFAALSGEDLVGLDVLADYGSTEWGWLRGIYDQLGEAVRADGATLALVINPLEYELDPAYPISPGPAFARYCAERKLACFDLLPAMREHRAEKPFIGVDGDIFDIWHYTPTGHRIAAEALADLILKADLLPKR
jgi:hypothetical protein